MRSTELIFASVLVLASAVALGCSRANEPVAGEAKADAGQLTEDVREVILTATTDGMLEVEAARLAESRAQTEPVRQFARMMAEHHARANEELAALAERKHVELPASLDDEAQDELEGLRDEIGRDFDEEYLDLMIDEHQRVIRQLEREAKRKGNDADIQQWASQTLPTLRSHLDEAKRTEDSIDETPPGGVGGIGSQPGARDGTPPGTSPDAR